MADEHLERSRPVGTIGSGSCGQLHDPIVQGVLELLRRDLGCSHHLLDDVGVPSDESAALASVVRERSVQLEQVPEVGDLARRGELGLDG
jgi:hypothetical protein